MNWVTVVKIIALPSLAMAFAVALAIAFGDEEFDVMGLA